MTLTISKRATNIEKQGSENAKKKWDGKSRPHPAPALLISGLISGRPLRRLRGMGCPQLSSHPPANGKIYPAASQQGRASSVLDKSLSLSRLSFMYSAPLEWYELTKKVKEKGKEEDQHLAPQYLLVFAANLPPEIEGIKEKIEWAPHSLQDQTPN